MKKTRTTYATNASLAFLIACSFLFQSFKIIRNSWFLVSSAEGKFSAVFPTRPNESKTSFHYGKKSYQAHSFTFSENQNGGTRLQLVYFTNEQVNSEELDFYKTTSALDSTQLQFFHDFKPEFLGEKIIETKGFSGREYSYTSNTNLSVIRSRAFLVGNTFYILTAECAGEKNAEHIFTTFFNSFTPTVK